MWSFCTPPRERRTGDSEAEHRVGMIAYCVHYKAGKRLETDISLERAAELAREGDGFVWVALREPSREELRDVGRAFGLSALGVEDEGPHAS